MRPTALALLLVALAACGSDEPAPGVGAPEPRHAAPAATDSTLADLGYVDYSEDDEESAEAGVGLLQRDPARSLEGYTLVTSLPEGRAFLVDDASGRTVREWAREVADEHWTRAELLPDGDLLVITRRRLPDGTYEDPAHRFARHLARYSFEGELRWRHPHRVHHDVDWTPHGEILALGERLRTERELELLDNTLLFLTPDGEPVRELSLFDLLTSRPELYELPRAVDFDPAILSNGRLDLLHANSCHWLPFEELVGTHAVYGAAHVVVSFRHLSLVAVFDVEREELVWAWGTGQVERQHEARWLPNGNLLVFDNGGIEREHSRVLEVDPRTSELAWLYEALEPTDFYSVSRGTAQRLANGNVLVASTNQGEVFEVTRGGDVLWRFVHREPDGGRRIAVRAARYDRGWVDLLLAGDGR